ncbi:MAG TPA: dTDP-4-dehydrorhamnose reductase [Chitinophagales bacterium]|nr:dTDP-4-dehydrorhamnose reductase [Chitinophagales bacterium]
MLKVLITGAHGQLGSEINFLSSLLETHNFVFTDKDDLDITNAAAVQDLIAGGKYSTVINCAAYTAVDKAESEKEIAYKINADAAGYLAKACSETGAQYVHVSTDFIFDGSIARPLLEDDTPNPLGIYGASKLEGEKLTLANNPHAIIFRTAWVYSSFGANFVKTILRLCKERESINVIYDQVGSPTYARDLAGAILKVVQSPSPKPGVYNYSNEGVASWYDFAVAIRDMAGLKTKINPIETSQYPTPAARPKYSLLNKKKVKETFGLEIPYWRDSLEQCMRLLK